MSALIICAVLLLTLIFVIKDYLKQRRVDKASGFVGPKSYPILGTILEISSLDPGMYEESLPRKSYLITIDLKGIFTLSFVE
jgi:hypothetical protein